MVLSMDIIFILSLNCKARVLIKMSIDALTNCKHSSIRREEILAGRHILVTAIANQIAIILQGNLFMSQLLIK